MRSTRDSKSRRTTPRPAGRSRWRERRLGLAGCASPPAEPVNLLAPTEEQMKIRNLQTRTFDVSDRRGRDPRRDPALQDLGFIIERANEPLGMVTGARFAEPRYFDVVGITVTVRAVGESRR